MADVLRIVEREEGLLAQRRNLLAYMERAKARPAFQRAMAAQLADFEDREVTAA